MGGRNRYEGRLEVYKHPYGWGTVCADMFEYEEAEVACHMLGFTGGVPKLIGDDEGTGTIALDDVNYMGTEEDLWDCEHNEWGEHNCNHLFDVSLVCG